MHNQCVTKSSLVMPGNEKKKNYQTRVPDIGLILPNYFTRPGNHYTSNSKFDEFINIAHFTEISCVIVQFDEPKLTTNYVMLYL